MGGYAGQMFDLLWRVLFHRLPVGLKPLREACDVVFVVQLLFQQHIAKGVNQCHIAAVFQLQMLVGNAGCFNPTRIADDNFRTVLTGFQHAAGDYWMGIGAVVSENQQAF